MGEDLELVEYMGSAILAEVDKATGLLKCPLCASLFASPRDLIYHIKGHALQGARRAPA